MKPLTDKVALVAGATRGAGRGIALALAKAGATVYCSGRSTRDFPSASRPETIEETAELVNAHGGVGFWERTDHTQEGQVEALFKRIRWEQGRLDILVNDVWGGDALTEWGKPFWELDMTKGRTMIDRAISSHIITSRYGVPLMLDSERGLLVEITDGDPYMNRLYRGNLFYDLVKVTAMRMAKGMAVELRDTNITALALTPGFLRSEAMLEHFGVTEENWQEGIAKDPFFAHSESPALIGRAIAHLAADPDLHLQRGKSLSSWGLAKHYGFTDYDGRVSDLTAIFKARVDENWESLVSMLQDKLPQFSADSDQLCLTCQWPDGSQQQRPINMHELLMSEPADLIEEIMAKMSSTAPREIPV